MTLFVTVELPSPDMTHEANVAGLYEWTRFGLTYLKVQIITIEMLLSGEKLNLPILREEPIPQAQKVKKKSSENPELPGLE